MKKTIIILLGAVVALSGCKHSEIPGEEAPVSGRRIVAEATLGNGVKSHFDTDGYNLVWDSTDKLLVYSNYMGTWENYQALVEQIQSEYPSMSIDEENAGIIAYFRLLRDNADKRYAGTFSISSGAGQTTAEFASDGLASTWMAEGADDELYYFVPFYPAPAVAPEMKSFYFEEVTDINPMAAEAPFPYLNFTIQPVQDGVNYQNYQLLMGGTDGPSVKGNLIAGEKIPFDNFMPLTSILEFTMQTSSGSGEIDHMDITLSTQEEADAVYVSNKYMIAGNVPLFFSWDEPNEMRFWNRACKPFLGGFGSSWNDYHHDFEATGWEEFGSDATSTLRLQFDSPVSVNASAPTTQKYYAVMIPSRCIHKSGCGNPRLTFDAYDASGNKIFTKTIETTSTQGIEEGTKYPFDLVLDKPASPEDNIVLGEFSVSASQQVNFSRGNLFLNPQFASGQRWGFAPFQHMSGVWYGRRNVTYEDSWFTSSQMIDLFGWATAGVKNSAGEYGATPTQTAYQPWDFVNNKYAYGPAEEAFGGATSWRGTDVEAYCEWGMNPEFVAIYGEGWRTLSYEEWRYLLFDRSASTVDGVSNARFCKGTYQGYEGLFVFSDTFGSDTPNPFLSDFAGAPINQEGAAFDSVVIEFSENENYSTRYYGLVFLPVNALREGNELGYYSYGTYWSSTPLGDDDAYGMSFDPDYVMRGKDCELGRCLGLSVRLVKDIE